MQSYPCFRLKYPVLVGKPHIKEAKGLSLLNVVHVVFKQSKKVILAQWLSLICAIVWVSIWVINWFVCCSMRVRGCAVGVQTHFSSHRQPVLTQSLWSTLNLINLSLIDVERANNNKTEQVTMHRKLTQLPSIFYKLAQMILCSFLCSSTTVWVGRDLTIR